MIILELEIIQCIKRIKWLQIKSKKYYKNGKIEGKFAEFDENGNKIKEGFYKEGKLEGLVLNYNKYGKIFSKII